MAHYYTQEGDPRHFIPKKDGTGDRPTTIKDARKEGLLPSVTTIIKVMNKPALDQWRMGEVAKAALAYTPASDAEPLDNAIANVLASAEANMSVAADFGSEFHGHIEALLSGGSEVCHSVTPNMDIAFEQAKEFLLKADRIIASEKTVIGDGYAGKFDLICEMDERETLVDFKSRKPSGGKLRPYFDSDAVQLAAYRAALGRRDLRCMSALFSSDGKVEPTFIVWGEDELAKALEIFRALQQVWILTNDYDPRSR